MQNHTKNNYIPFNPAKAFESKVEWVPLEKALGRTSARLVNYYPPGDIALCLGEIVTSRHISRFRSAHQRKDDAFGLKMVNGQPHVLVTIDPKYKIVTRDPQTLTSAEIKAYTTLFRETFANAPYSQMAYAGECWENALSASQVIYDRTPSKQDYVGIQTIDGFTLPEGLHLYMEKGETEKVLADRFSDGGYLALLYETATQRLCGFCFARVASLRRIWETEEWKWALILNGNRTIEANEKLFFEKMYEAFSLSPETIVLSVSGQAIHPDVRGRSGWFGKLMKATVSQFTVEDACLPGLTELSQSGSGRILNEAVAHKVVGGILENGNPLAYVPLASHSLWHYEGPPERLLHAIRNQIRKEKGNV